jgi:predicted O-methyltransferase YrrM
VLFKGQVVGEKMDQDATSSVITPHVKALREFNEHISKDDSVEKTLMPVFDGLMLIWYKQSG